jgi:hypothetical protein
MGPQYPARYRTTSALPPPCGCQGMPSPHNSFMANASYLSIGSRGGQSHHSWHSTFPRTRASHSDSVLQPATLSVHDPSQWSLMDPDPRDIGSFAPSKLIRGMDFPATMLLVITRPVPSACTAFVPNLWPSFQQHCLSPSRVADSCKWQAGISRE